MSNRRIDWQHDGVQFEGRRVSARPSARAQICLVHGLGDHSGRYGEWIDRCAAAGFEVATFDLRGHGKSGGRRGDAVDVAQLVGDVRGFLDVCRPDPDRPRFVYGHSFGGCLALHLAAAPPTDVRGIIATAPAIRPGTPPPRWKVAVARLLRPIVPGLRMDTGVPADGLHREGQAEFAADPLTHRLVSVRLGLDLLEAGEQLLTQAYAPRVPTLVMHGDEDPVTSYAASAAYAAAHPAVEFRGWPQQLHELHHEPRSAEVDACVRDWIERQLASSQ